MWNRVLLCNLAWALTWKLPWCSKFQYFFYHLVLILLTDPVTSSGASLSMKHKQSIKGTKQGYWLPGNSDFWLCTVAQVTVTLVKTLSNLEWSRNITITNYLPQEVLAIMKEKLEPNGIKFWNLPNRRQSGNCKRTCGHISRWLLFYVLSLLTGKTATTSASLLIQICRTPVSSEQEVHTCTGTESQGKGTSDRKQWLCMCAWEPRGSQQVFSCPKSSLLK